MNYEHRLILRNKRDILSKRIKLEDLKPMLIEHKIFNKCMWRDINSTADMIDTLPFRGPKAFQNFIEILRKTKYNEEADILENNNLCKEIPDSNLNYKMTSKSLGVCFIINNVDFDKSESENESAFDRTGSDIDARNLFDFFESIGFEVIVKRNCKASEMLGALIELSERDFQYFDSLIIIILSHGDSDCIYGTDWDSVHKLKMCHVFNNDDCKSLQSKPKVFFFVSCRGTGMDYGVPKCLPNESIDASIEILMPSLSDILVIHSTLPHHVSVRSHDKGTYFCEELVSILKKHYRTYDLETMIKVVNKNLQHKVSLVYRTVQVAHVEALGVTKRIMLCKTSDSQK